MFNHFKGVNDLKNNIIVLPNVEPVKPVVKIQIDSKEENISKNIKTNPKSVGF